MGLESGATLSQVLNFAPFNCTEVGPMKTLLSLARDAESHVVKIELWESTGLRTSRKEKQRSKNAVRDKSKSKHNMRLNPVHFELSYSSSHSFTIFAT